MPPSGDPEVTGSWRLTLFVAGRSARGLRAQRSVTDLLTERPDLDIDLEVVDVMRDTARADQEGVVATPALTRWSPAPCKRVVGDLSDLRRLADALDLPPAPPRPPADTGHPPDPWHPPDRGRSSMGRPA